MKKLLYHIVSKIFVAGILFLLFLPLMFLMMKPHEDLIYHLGRPAPSFIDPADWDRSIKNNICAVVKGTIDSGSFSPRHHFRTTTFLFRLREYPSSLLIHLRTGRIHQRFTEACVDRKSKLPEEALHCQYTFEGRIYHSGNLLGSAFEHYYNKKELNFDGYLSKKLNDTRQNLPQWVAGLESSSGKKNETVDYWLLADGEKPSPGALLSSNCAVFIFGIALGVTGLVFCVVLAKQAGR
ncbi:MAG: hypothetical protein AB9903_31295 [Vulcanimicrobiota bacterium]